MTNYKGWVTTIGEISGFIEVSGFITCTCRVFKFTSVFYKSVNLEILILFRYNVVTLKKKTQVNWHVLISDSCTGTNSIKILKNKLNRKQTSFTCQ